MTEAQVQYPEYVTDGHHIYKWHKEYATLFGEGRLKPSDPPVIQKNRPLTPREKTKIEASRKKALADAEAMVRALKPAEELVDLDEVFGSEPK